MNYFEVTYNGKSYKSISDAFKQSIIDGIKEDFEESLKPFKSEIIKSGGRVKIDVDQNLENVKIDFIDLPDDLIDRLNNAL